MSTIEIISFQQKSESKPSNFAGDDLEDVLVEIVEKPELFLFYLLLKNNTSDTHYYYYYYFFYTSITHYLKKKIQSPGTIFLVCLGINQQKSAQKSIRYGNIK